MKRTFIAVKTEPGEKLRNAINLLRNGLDRESIKWVDPDIMHLTLAFLGNTEDEIIRMVSHHLKEKCSGTGEISFTIKGLGVFPGINNPRVIWAGIENADTLLNLQKIVTGIITSLNIPAEEREFMPHLTLGRVKFLRNTGKLKQLISEHENIEFQNVRLNKLIYYESILMPAGPLYKPITEINL